MHVVINRVQIQNSLERPGNIQGPRAVGSSIKRCVRAVQNQSRRRNLKWLTTIAETNCMNSINVGSAPRIPMWNSFAPIDRMYWIVAGDVVSCVYAAARQPATMIACFAPFKDHTMKYPREVDKSPEKISCEVENQEMRLGEGGVLSKKSQSANTGSHPDFVVAIRQSLTLMTSDIFIWLARLRTSPGSDSFWDIRETLPSPLFKSVGRRQEIERFLACVTIQKGEFSVNQVSRLITNVRFT
jgi:hypothetical protein